MSGWPLDRMEWTLVGIGLALIIGSGVAATFGQNVVTLVLAIAGVLLAGAPAAARML